MTTRLELTLTAPAGGNASVGRDESGRAVFADGGLPGETVVVELNTEKKRFARGTVVDVLDASPARREPACDTARQGCGGCDLAHATLDLQQSMKRRVVRDALTRIARIEHPPEIGLVSTADARYRTTLRAAVRDGRAGYRRRASHDVILADECLVAHPLAEEVLTGGRWGDASEVVIRVSASTGERLAIVDGSGEGVEVPEGTIVATSDELAAGADVYLTEDAAGRAWRVSAESFFQAGPAAASALVASVSRLVGNVEGLDVVDAYSGIGLFAGTVGVGARSIVAIESSPTSTADARENLAGMNALVMEERVEHWTPIPADIVIADPARTGLGDEGVDVLAACAASRFVLVSCDTGSLGRDIGLLVGRGYRLDAVEIVDAFPDTSHVETVVALSR
ncbi:MAG: class I SAM-dependent RNA methyltransferase [Acidimicrobiales bacterium]